MARKRILTDELIRKIQARRRQGIPFSDLAREFELSIGSVHGAVNTRLEDPAQAKQKRGKRAKADGPERAPRKPIEDDADVLAILRRQVEVLEELAEEAHKGEEIGSYRLLSATLTKTISLLAKLTPPPPPDTETSADIMAAAKRCREKLHMMLKNILEQEKLEGAA